MVFSFAYLSSNFTPLWPTPVNWWLQWRQRCLCSLWYWPVYCFARNNQRLSTWVSFRSFRALQLQHWLNCHSTCWAWLVHWRQQWDFHCKTFTRRKCCVTQECITCDCFTFSVVWHLSCFYRSGCTLIYQELFNTKLL